MILDELVAVTTKRQAQRQLVTSPEQMHAQAVAMPDTTRQVAKFLTSLASDMPTIIGELKQASPSRGQIVPLEQFDYLNLAQAYDHGGVDAISVLTEQDYFKGRLAYLKQVARYTSTPLLRKDFTISRYMIDEAKVAGATLILLIVAILTDGQLRDYLQYARDLGMEAIVEAHDESEIKRALAADAQIIGINNRNLKTFQVDTQNTVKLRDFVPKNVFLIAESGLKTTQEIAELAKVGVNGFLIGETLMTSSNPTLLVEAFKGALR
ncbi:MAG TPA: indole-3-glycerol phosphate synthase TrpC [Lactobacillaceae bacterium]|jgi:indole-3-glycerol phosphate synthase